MNETRSHLAHEDPVVIGGVGGSGTGLIAKCLDRLGFFMGSDLNGATDNLWFTLLFKHEEILSASREEFDALVAVFLKGSAGSQDFTADEVALVRRLASRSREQHPRSWLKERAESLLSHRGQNRLAGKWGWKEPNSHIVLDRLIESFPKMKYIHAARNGLDMAHSTNQNQLKLWGKHFLGRDCEVSPFYSLKYWCLVHRRVIETARPLGAHFLFLNYDDFCLRPETGIDQLCQFLGVSPTAAQRAQMKELIDPPQSMGRFRRYGTGVFDQESINCVREFGFDVAG